MCKIIFLLFCVLPLVIVADISLVDSPEKVNWCEIEKEYCTNLHIACFDKEDPENYIDGVQFVDLSEENKRDLVNRYNYHRNRVAGGKFPGIPYQAANMMKLEWDDNLEYMSRVDFQRFHAYCQIAPGGKRAFKSKNTGWGRKIYNEDAQNFTFIKFDELYSKLVTTNYYWFQDEVAKSNYRFELESGKVKVTSVFNTWYVIDYYSKYFDERTFRLGYALAKSLHNDVYYARYNVYFTFTENYKIGDNLIYKVGPPCSGCKSLGMRCSTEYPNLCETIPKENATEIPNTTDTTDTIKVLPKSPKSPNIHDILVFFTEFPVILFPVISFTLLLIVIVIAIINYINVENNDSTESIAGNAMEKA